MHQPDLQLHPEVAAALADGRPVVALESTIIAHGFPYPENLAMARTVEAAVRAAGAVPATIAVLGGRCKVGLTEAEVEALATRADLPKASVRDLPVLVGLGGDGATTVASTAHIAARAGISVFVTGGIGGVHRGAAATFDVSADLPVLARTSLAVVCAGAKSVLDIPATLEYLETHGVTVLGYQISDFPSFYTRTTGLPVDARVESPAAAAAVLRARRRLGLPGAVLVANPLPEAVALEPERVEAILARALEELGTAGIRGKDVTPYLLRRLREETGGESVRANAALVEANARLGAAIAAALAAEKE